MLERFDGALGLLKNFCYLRTGEPADKLQEHDLPLIIGQGFQGDGKALSRQVSLDDIVGGSRRRRHAVVQRLHGPSGVAAKVVRRQIVRERYNHADTGTPRYVNEPMRSTASRKTVAAMSSATSSLSTRYRR